MMNVILDNDRAHIMIAAQTVLALNKERLSIDSVTIQELSEEIVNKAMLFKRVASEVESGGQDYKRKTWGQLLKRLNNDALMDSYYNALELMLEKEFIEMLLEEIRKRQLRIDIQPENSAGNLQNT